MPLAIAIGPVCPQRSRLNHLTKVGCRAHIFGTSARMRHAYGEATEAGDLKVIDQLFRPYR